MGEMDGDAKEYGLEKESKLMFFFWLKNGLWLKVLWGTKRYQGQEDQ